MILDFLDDINWAAVGAALVAAFAIGLVWFSPSALGGFWARQVSRYAGIPEGEITRGASQPSPLAKWLVAIAITSVAMARWRRWMPIRSAMASSSAWCSGPAWEQPSAAGRRSLRACRGSGGW